MGTSSIILLTFSIIVFMMLLVNINFKTSTSLDETTGKLKITQARLIANSALNLNFNKLRLNKNLRGNFTNNPLMNGTYDIDISGNDTVTITAVGKFFDKTSEARAKIIWENIVLPPIKSAIGIAASNLDLNLNGNILINGNDTNPDGSAGSAPSVLGMGVQNVEDSIRVADSLSSKIKSSILGSGGTPSIGVNTDSLNYAEITSEFIQAADIILPSGTYSSGTTLGTLAQPKITYVTGDVHFAGNASGAGVLIVYGNMNWGGNFIYHGLVIVYGNTSIYASATGNSAIYGSVLVAGQSVNLSATGSTSIYYSSMVLDTIKEKLKSAKFIIKDWLEEI